MEKRFSQTGDDDDWNDSSLSTLAKEASEFPKNYPTEAHTFTRRQMCQNCFEVSLWNKLQLSNNKMRIIPFPLSRRWFRRKEKWVVHNL